MKRILTVVVALVLVGYLGCGAYAADVAAGSAGQPSSMDNSNNMGSGMVKEGSERIAISGGANYGSMSGNTDLSISVFMVQGEYGYMVCDQFELAARALIALAQEGYAGGHDRLQAYSLTVVPKWRIPVEGNITPYVGPLAGVAYVTTHNSTATKIAGFSGSFNDTVFTWGAVLGADIFLSKHTSLFVELDYTQFKLNGHDFGGGSDNVQDAGVAAGLAYWW